MKRVLVLTLAFLLLFGAALHANAAVRAWLDRDHIALGDSITLTIEADGSSGNPDLAELRKDFDVGGMATGSQTTIVNGSMKSSVQWSVTLMPRHAGAIDIPALAVGGERTLPLRVSVDAHAAAEANGAASTQPTSAANADKSIFVESTVAPTNPYVQQAAIYTVRLYYAVTPLDAGLDVAPPDNGDLRQIGDDATTSVMVQGRRYDMLERHYLLQPERSGALHIPAPVFHGRTMADINNLFDDATSAGGGEVRVPGKPIDLQVRPRPQQVSVPWLPARALQLAVDPPTAPVHAGEPFSFVVRVDGEGVTAAQLPEIQLPTIPGVQVYPEPSSTSERARGGSLVAERSRRFAIVPEHAGDLRLPALEMPWWDVVNDHAAVAHLDLPALQVLPGAGGQNDTSSGTSQPADGATISSTASSLSAGNASALRVWQIATLSLALLLAVSLWWGWRRGSGDNGSSESAHAAVERSPSGTPTLSRALALGDSVAIAQALIEAAPAVPNSPAPHSLGEVARRLDDPVQRAAVLAFDAARWSADGVPSEQALAQLRSAFAQPPRWAGRTRSPSRDDALPPLYPS